MWGRGETMGCGDGIVYLLRAFQETLLRSSDNPLALRIRMDIPDTLTGPKQYMKKTCKQGHDFSKFQLAFHLLTLEAQHDGVEHFVLGW